MIVNPQIIKAGSVVKAGEFTTTSLTTVTVPDLIGAKNFLVAAVFANDSTLSNEKGSKILAIYCKDGVVSAFRSSPSTVTDAITYSNSTSASVVQFDAETGTFTTKMSRPSGFFLSRKYCYAVY